MGHVHVKVRRIKVIRDMFALKIVFTHSSDSQLQYDLPQ